MFEPMEIDETIYDIRVYYSYKKLLYQMLKVISTEGKWGDQLYCKKLLRYGYSFWKSQEKICRLSEIQIKTNMYDSWNFPLLRTI